MKQKLPALFLYILAALFFVNIIQAAVTELIFDEAYYWYYAQNLAWGYFDHPPMVAFLIKLSSFLFDGELGVRFMSCVLGIGTFVFLWLLIDDPRKKQFIPHFYVFMLSITLLHAYGFLILPDTPLLFFTAMFLWMYKKFLSAPSYLNAAGLGVLMGALMFSKYHAFLVIFFVILSNWKLVKNKYAWIAVLVSLLCYSPHFLWLYENDFVSIKYHLFERPNRPYEFMDFTLGYFINIVALFGLTFPWVYKSLFKTKATNLFTKALLYLSYGFLIFFFVSSFQRRVQTQWLIVICIPMSVLVFQYMLNNATTMKWIFRLGLVNIALLLYLRFGLVFEPMFPIVYESHGNTTWVQKITSQIEDVPVVFENSYRLAPMFAFYTGKTSYSLNNAHYRENQYSIDASESYVQDQKVIYISKYLKEGDISYTMPNGRRFYGIYMDNFRSYRKLRVQFEKSPVSLSEDATEINVFNPYTKQVPVNELQFGVVYLNAYKQLLEIKPIDVLPSVENIDYLAPHEHTEFRIKIPTPDAEDVAYVKVVISENGLRWGLNGITTKIK